jgi:hypothetical protein
VLYGAGLCGQHNIRTMTRWLLLLHRYLGIGLGLLMVMWCLSGVVMMYVGYPALAEAARIKQLAPIDWNGCCRLSGALRTDPGPAAALQIEMLAGRPVLYLEEQSQPIDLLTGSVIGEVSATQATRAARDFLGMAGSSAAPQLLGLIDHDQWTVSGDFNRLRPLYRFALGDAAGTQLYISSVSGRAVQITTAHERFWNWLGAVPHWLYFSELRRNARLWSQVVIYSSLLGCFLTAIGIYLGVRALLMRPPRRFSPYIGFNLWHHIAGLVFGILALTWVASGLLSMNPWGWLEGAGAETENAKIHGRGLSASELSRALQKVGEARPPAISLNSAPLNDRLFFIAHLPGGETLRLDAAGSPAALNSEDLVFLSQAVAGQPLSAAPELLPHEDDFYFSHHRQIAPLPIYRLIVASGTRYYFDSVSGMLVAKQDSQAQAYRWLHEGLHRMDFAAAIRSRPQWDALMLMLMAGVTVVCFTGAYLGLRRLTRNV